MKEPVLDGLIAAGFIVTRMRYTVTCPVCNHQYNLNVPSEEYLSREHPNPNWLVCWPCRAAEGKEV